MSQSGRSRDRPALSAKRSPESRSSTVPVPSGYSGTPLPKKLGIQAGSVVALLDAPVGFEERLEPLPEGAMVRRGARGRNDLTIWFVRSVGRLRARMARVGEGAGRGGLWIAWPKKASGVATDVTRSEVRRVGLDAGWVDHKICAIDSIWSGLKFARRS